MKVILKEPLKRIKSSDEYKYLYTIDDQYCVINIKKELIVFDYKYKDDIMKYTWCISQNDYAYTHDNGNMYMHRIIMDLSKQPNYDNTDLTVDHINWIKLDNRVINLRMATQSVQNSNRAVRSDKKEPNQELKEAGIIEFPKYVSWAEGEKKFIIESHPKLVQDIKDGVRKKAIMSGTKSTKLSIQEKYKDILARLRELNETITSDFNEIFEQRKLEYNDICDCIQKYEGTYIELPDIEKINISQKRNTVSGRKNISNLPDDCGVSIEQIPKYCYYHPKSDKRSDKFVIDKRHPASELDGKGWSTTSSKDKTTLEKFNQLITKYESLEI